MLICKFPLHFSKKVQLQVRAQSFNYEYIPYELIGFIEFPRCELFYLFKWETKAKLNAYVIQEFSDFLFLISHVPLQVMTEHGNRKGLILRLFFRIG